MIDHMGFRVSDLIAAGQLTTLAPARSASPSSTMRRSLFSSAEARNSPCPLSGSGRRSRHSGRRRIGCPPARSISPSPRPAALPSMPFTRPLLLLAVGATGRRDCGDRRSWAIARPSLSTRTAQYRSRRAAADPGAHYRLSVTQRLPRRTRGVSGPGRLHDVDDMIAAGDVDSGRIGSRIAAAADRALSYRDHIVGSALNQAGDIVPP